MDPNYLYCLFRFVSFEWENLESISNGESGRIGLRRVQLPLSSLEEVKKAAPGAFVEGESSTSSFDASLPDVQVALEGVENSLAPKIRGGGQDKEVAVVNINEADHSNACKGDGTGDLCGSTRLV